jgi:hypothetical protein
VSMNGGHAGGQGEGAINTGYGTLDTIGNSHTGTPADLNGGNNTTANLGANAMAGANSWTAQTLADATTQHTVQFDLSSLTGNDGASGSSRNNGVNGVNGKGVVLPEWPLPPQGPGSRLAMSAEEIAARRRARNRVAGE